MTYQEELFALVQEAFKEGVDLGSGELLRVATDYGMGGSVDVTVALVAHSADINTEGDEFDFMNKTWTEMFVEALRRTFYDEAGAAKYGTSHIYNNELMLKMITVEMVNYANSSKFDDIEFPPMELPANVVQFPSPCKTRQ